MMNPKPSMNDTHVAVVGGGLAGLTCAFHLARAGVPVTLYEAAPSLGGRARVVANHPLLSPQINDVAAAPQFLDNGPHLMLGAYQTFSRLIHDAHLISHSQTPKSFEGFLNQYFYRQPFAMKSATLTLKLGTGNYFMALLQTLQQSRGLHWQALREHLGNARMLLGVLRHQPTDETVAQWLSRMKVSRRWQEEYWQPLCLSALNTEPTVASANVFVEVLRRVFLGGAAAWEMRWSKVDLATLYINPMQQALLNAGGKVALRQRIRAYTYSAHGVALLPWHPHEPVPPLPHHSHVVLATPAWQSSRLLQASPTTPSSETALQQRLIQALQAIESRPIANVSFFARLPWAPWLQPWLATMPVLTCQHWQGTTIIWLNHTVVNPERLTQHEVANLAPLLTAIYSSVVPEKVAAFSRHALAALAPSATLNFSAEAMDQSLTCKVIQEQQATHAASVAKMLAQRALPTPKQPIDARGLIYLTGDYLHPLLPATLETAALAGTETAAALLSAINMKPSFAL